LITRFLDWDLQESTRLRMKEYPRLLRRAAIFFAHSGDSWFWFAGLALIWWFGDADWKMRALVLIAGILVTAVLVMTLKFTIRRQRPEGDWGAIYRKTDPHSFPSGHAARAFLLPVLATGVGPGWFAAALWIWAPLVALARVVMGVHYISDILAGSVLGIVMGVIILQFV
jgi:undecaprenyl-diphosphatase